MRLQWVGHATALVDVVLLSHAHLDHLHLSALRKMHPNTQFFTPIGTSRLLRAAGFHDVTEVRVGDRIELDGPLVTAEVVPAAHKHGRGPHSRVTAPPVGYVVSGEGRRVYFPGDTDLFDEMTQLTDIDVALLPIWGWGSWLGTGHLDPTPAATATGRNCPSMVVPIHWGTYAPEDGRRTLPTWFDNPPQQFEHALADAGLLRHLHLLHPGESMTMTRVT